MATNPQALATKKKIPCELFNENKLLWTAEWQAVNANHTVDLVDTT